LLGCSDGRRASTRKAHLREQRQLRLGGAYQFEPKNNTYDLAKKFAAESKLPLRIFVVVGSKDMNYQANLEWMAYLKSLNIPFEQRIIEGVPHNTQMVYEKAGVEIMKFHAESFKKVAK